MTKNKLVSRYKCMLGLLHSNSCYTLLYIADIKDYWWTELGSSMMKSHIGSVWSPMEGENITLHFLSS